MKNKFLKLLNNKNLKIIIPIIVLFVLLIVVFIYLREYKYNQYRNKQDSSFYQYFVGEKVEYDATISYNKDDEIKGFVPKIIKVNFDSTPIYFSEEEKVIFPDEMNLIFPLKSKQYKTKEFAYIKKSNNINYLTFDDYSGNIDHYIMFDGENLYFFSDSVNLIIEGENITLSPMSYVIAKQNEFSYYNYENDEYKKYDMSDEIIVTNEYYTLSVTNDYLSYDDNKLVLTSDIDFLKVLEKE